MTGANTGLTDIEVALAATAAGVAVAVASFGSNSKRIAKTSADFATEVDLATERAIRAVITAQRPDDLVEGEENGLSGPVSSPRRWLIDPLCGTLNYAAGTPLAAVNVVLAGPTGAIVAVSADPIAGETFWTDGHHARSGGADNETILVPSPRSRLVDVNCDADSDAPFLGPQLIADRAFCATFGPRVLSTSLALAWVAAGRRAAYVTDGRFLDQSVHFAAGIALCRASGCQVTDLAGHHLDAGRGLIAAADPATHARLLALIHPHLLTLDGSEPADPPRH